MYPPALLKGLMGQKKTTMTALDLQNEHHGYYNSALKRLDAEKRPGNPISSEECPGWWGHAVA